MELTFNVINETSFESDLGLELPARIACAKTASNGVEITTTLALSTPVPPIISLCVSFIVIILLLEEIRFFVS